VLALCRRRASRFTRFITSRIEPLAATISAVNSVSFETTFAERVPHKLFRFSDGYQLPSLNLTFRRLMRETGFLNNEDGQNRTLYSLRHTYATLELLRNSTDIHTQQADGQLSGND
jgi:integrase